MENIENINFWYNYYNETISQISIGMKTSLKSIDEITGCIKKKNLYCIGGRIGMGCNYLLIQWLTDISLNYNCLYISNKNRYDVLIPHIDTYIKSIEKDTALNTSKRHILSLNLEYGYRIKYSFEEIIKDIKTKYASNPFEALFLDDIQDIYMQYPQKNRATELEKICIELKELAYELDIAIIFTSKLKDPINNSSKQHPSIYQIKDSNAIEYISDSILLLYIPSYFDCEAYDDEGNLLLNKLIITIHNKDKIHSVTLNTVFSENRITDLVIV